jgi:hypothetical protein
MHWRCWLHIHMMHFWLAVQAQALIYISWYEFVISNFVITHDRQMSISNVYLYMYAYTHMYWFDSYILFNYNIPCRYKAPLMS